MEPEPKHYVREYSEARLDLYGRLAWLSAYDTVYELEAQINGAAAAVEHYQSDYRRQQMGAGNDDARKRSMLRISQDYERLLREEDGHYVPFSQAIKSAAWVVDQVPTATWEKERKDKRIAGRTYGVKLLWKMLDVRPDPEEPENPDVSLWVYDQVNSMAGGGHGHGSKKFGGIGRIDKQGERIEVQRETYINSFDVHVSVGDCQLSDAARDVIERRGPYTQDFARILPVMAPECAQTFMDELLVKACDSLKAITDSNSKLNVEEAMRAILGRKTQGGRALRLEDLPPLMRTNTAKLVDGVKIYAHYRRWRERRNKPKGIVVGSIGDGQSVLLTSYLKRHWPELYKHIIDLNGGWHSSGHFQIQGVTILAWKAFYGRLAMRLQRTPVKGERKGTLWEGMKNLDKNAHWHTQQFTYSTVIATFIYIINFVKVPPPSLFLRSPVLYMSLVENATGIVMLQALRHVGLPVVEWHQAAREERGWTIDRLHGLAYHEYRCTHKTNSQVISIIHLLAMYATHPELRAWLHTTNSGMTHKVFQYFDRILEARNDMQKERNVGHSLMNSLHFTPVQPAMQHVRQAYRRSEFGAKEADDGIRHSMPNEVDELVRFFVAEIGDDLATYTEKNVLWHTGNPRGLRNDTNREHLFWEYMKGVAEGTRVPKGRKRAKRWNQQVRETITEHMFYC